MLKRSYFFPAILLGSFTLILFSACTNSDTKASDAGNTDSAAKMQATTPPAAAATTMAKDSGKTDLDTTAHPRPLLPGHKVAPGEKN